jgi:hypothetical protein
VNWRKLTDDDGNVWWAFRRQPHDDDLLMLITDASARQFAREVLELETPDDRADAAKANRVA